MNIMDQVITIVQSGAIPLLAIMTFIAVMSTMKVPGKQTATDVNDFKMTESGFWLMIAFYCLVAAGLFAWLSITNTVDSQVAANYVMIAICGIGCALTIYIYFKRKLIINGEEITYCPIKGKKETFLVKNISRMEIVQKDYFEEMSAYSKTGKLLFKVQGYMTNSELLPKYMRQNRVRVIKANIAN